MNNTSACAGLCKVSAGLCVAAVLCQISGEAWDALRVPHLKGLENLIFISSCRSHQKRGADSVRAFTELNSSASWQMDRIL